MAPRHSPLLRVAFASLLLGVGLIGFSEWAQIQSNYPEGSWTHLLSRFSLDLGMAFAVGSIVALILEWGLAEQHTKKITGLLEDYRHLKEAGFQSTFPDRQKFFDHFFNTVLHNVRHELKIMGICISLFRESDRPERVVAWTKDDTLRRLVNAIQRGCSVKVLFLKRYPTTDELRQYGVSQEADFYFMRERDEDPDYNFLCGKRLKKIANISVGCWITLLIELARQTQDYTADKRREILNRLEIREYISLPSLSLYIADEDIFVTPYLVQRHCSTAPMFQVTGAETPLYRSYNGHFDATWANPSSTTSAIDEEFIQLLVDNPKETLDSYKRKYDEIVAAETERVRQTPDRLQDPEHYRAEENVIRAVIAEAKSGSNKSVTASMPNQLSAALASYS